jgi:hypothetical protein
MFVDAADGAPSRRLAHRSSRHRPPRPRWFLFAVLAIAAALAVGPAASYARRAGARGSVHHEHRTASRAGLVSAWGFGGGSAGTGATIADASRHGNTITLVNATLTAAGKYGGGVRFTGQDSFATARPSRSLSLTSQMTLEAWVRPSKVASGSATIIAKTRAGGGFPYGLDLTRGRPDAYGMIGGRFVNARTRVRLPRNRWSFVAATYDGSTLRVYVGARLAAKVAAKGKFRKSAGPLQMGGNEVWGEYLAGTIDNVRIFSKARSPKQLARDRRTPVPGGIVHGPLSTTGGTGGTGAGGAGSPGGGTIDVGPIGPGAGAGLGLPPPAGPAVYVSQSTAGSGDGSSCANAHSAGWFNTSSSWGTGAGQIGPGDVVHLCGTISSNLRVLGSGRSGSPISIYFEPGASISMPVCPGNGTGCLNTNGQTYLTIDGGGSGVIQSTQNGTNLPQQSGAALGIEALGCTGCTIEYVTVQDMYVHSSATDTAANNVNGMVFSGSNVTIQDDTFHDDDWAVVSEWNNGDANARIIGNDLYNNDHGFASTAGFSGGNIGPVLFYANHVHDYANWDTTSASYHHDGIHCYTFGGHGPAHYDGFYIYDNVFDGQVGTDMTSHIFMEGGSGSGSTPCADSSSPIYIFNNVFAANQDINNGLLDPASGQPHVLNNTVVGPDTRGGTCYTSNSDATQEVFENNIVSTCSTLMYNNLPSIYSSGSPDYNVYAESSGNAFLCGSRFESFGSFGAWRSCIGADSHSSEAASMALNSDGSPQAGSPAIGAGANLTNLCTGALAPLCANIDGVARPATGPWNAGAF